MVRMEVLVVVVILVLIVQLGVIYVVLGPVVVDVRLAIICITVLVVQPVLLM